MTEVSFSLSAFSFAKRNPFIAPPSDSGILYHFYACHESTSGDLACNLGSEKRFGLQWPLQWCRMIIVLLEAIIQPVLVSTLWIADAGKLGLVAHIFFLQLAAAMTNSTFISFQLLHTQEFLYPHTIKKKSACSFSL